MLGGNGPCSTSASPSSGEGGRVSLAFPFPLRSTGWVSWYGKLEATLEDDAAEVGQESGPVSSVKCNR